MKKTSRAEREQQQLADCEKEEKIQLALQFSRKRFKKFEEVIQGLYMNEDLSPFYSDKRIMKINQCFGVLYCGKKDKGGNKSRNKFRDVLIYLYQHSAMVSGEESIQAIYNMVMFRDCWRNDIENWKPVTKKEDSQLKELVTFLFCKYKVPDFLYKSFYEANNTRHINWLIHIGTGGKVKEMSDIPIPFTQKMGHYFLHAPAGFSIIEALRWAQVKGLNGDDRLAARIAYSWIGTKTYKDEEFWQTFLLLLVNSGMFDHAKLTEVIDYVREMRRLDKQYTLKGRTLQSLLRRSDIWHGQFNGAKANYQWRPSGIEGYKLERKLETIVLEELTEAKKLSEEGKAMKHCVSSYSFYCAKGKSAIFSLRKYSSGTLLEIMATIEVNISLRRVVQAKAKMNKPITVEMRKCLEAWAMKEELELGHYL